MKKKVKKTKKTKKSTKKGLQVKGYKISEKTLNAVKEFIESVNSPEKLADYFNQGNDLKKVKKASIPYYEATSAKPSIWELLGWPDAGPNDPNPNPEWLDKIARKYLNPDRWNLSVGRDFILAAFVKDICTPIYDRLGMRFIITANDGGKVSMDMVQNAFKLSVDQAALAKDAAKAAVKKTETKTVAKKATAKKSTKATAKKVANKAAK